MGRKFWAGFWTGAAIVHASQAIAHRQTCPQCQKRDWFQVITDLAHLYRPL